MTRFLRAGVGEQFKGDCHAAMGILAGAFCLYNLGAFVLRRQSHLARNVALYGALTYLEYVQTRKHREGARS